MGLELRQIEINCPNCGEWIYDVVRTTYDLNSKVNSAVREEPVCRCHGPRFIDLLRNAEKIAPIIKGPDQRLKGSDGRQTPS